jgi:hypothetical protein
VKLPSDPDELWVALEPLFGKLSNGKPAFATLRATLPKAGATVKRAKALIVDGAQIVRGSLSVTDGVTLATNAMLVVLGDLTIRGGLWSDPHAFSAVIVGGTLDVDRAYTSGEALAFAGITAKLWWGIGNDHSTYTPALKTDLYIASDDRGDIVPSLKATKKIVAFDVRAKLAKQFPKLDPDDETAMRELIGGARSKPFAGATTKPGELDTLRAELATMWAMPERIPKVKVMRAIYANIAKRRLVEAGPLLLEMIARKHAARDDWSLQDELELLVKLRRADLLEAIPKQQLSGYESWMPGLLELARKR